MICRSPRHAGSETKPTHRYATESAARTAAQSMADQTGADFVILTTTATIRPKGQQDQLF